MGKVATAATAEMKKKKRKGQSSKTPIPDFTLNKPLTLPPNPIIYHRRRGPNPKFLNSPPPEFEDDDDDDERKEKKVKLVGGLPQSDENSKIIQKQKKSMRHSSDDDSASQSGPDSAPESEDHGTHAKKRKINAGDRGSDGAVSVQGKKVVKATEISIHGSPVVSGPTTTLPDKKLLVFILDRLQKKDTYGVFSDPVDIDELPDYFEVIEKPMDFGTVRKKLDCGAYKNLEELEADVFLISSNAMLYNAPGTIYYRQARSMQDIAKRDFENLRHEGDNGEPQPRIVRRGRPPSKKNQKKPLETSPVDRVGDEPSSGAILNSRGDETIGSSTYNLRKAPALNRLRSNNPYGSSYQPRNGEHSEWLADWNDEFPASVLRADMKHGKRQLLIVDENRRDTYEQRNPLSSANNFPFSTNSISIGEMKQLVPVGLHEPLAYARSLARYAANLGPVAWKVASRRIELVLPPGLQYGPGWVADIAPPSQPLSFLTDKQKSSNSSVGDSNSNKLVTPPTSDLSPPSQGMGEALMKLNSQNEVGVQGEASSWKATPFPLVPQRPVYQPQRNGFSGMFRYNASAVGPVYKDDLSSSHSPAMNYAIHEKAKYQENWSGPEPGYFYAPGNISDTYGEANMWSYRNNPTWPEMPTQQNSRGFAVPQDLNMRIPGGSPSSSLQIGGSSKPPDLALQL